MPYIEQKDRQPTIERGPITAGELNFLITLELIKAFKQAGCNYQAVHDIKNVIYYDTQHKLPEFRHRLCDIKNSLHKDKFDTDDFYTAKDLAFEEFYRRIVAPYEDAKARQNGDVYAELLAMIKNKIVTADMSIKLTKGDDKEIE